jgi:hypothetical protein
LLPPFLSSQAKGCSPTSGFEAPLLSYTPDVFTRLRWRLRESNERHERAKDEVAVERALREHEEGERQKAEPVDLPPGRSTTDWTYVNLP